MVVSLLILSLLISFLATIVVRKIALHKNILDFPNERSSHTVPTPRGGGFAILLAWYLGLIYLNLRGLIERDLFNALFAGIVLAFISLIDDLVTLKPMIRMLFQLITVLIGLYFIGWLDVIYVNSYILNIPLLINILVVIAALWFINLYNFLDGIDGYASVEAVLVSLGFYLITGNITLLLLIFSILGFLAWNWPKAKIFMGDIGSTQLGYVFVILGIYFNNKMQFNLIGLLILASLFWFDATLTLFRRLKNNERLSQAHKKHGYQRIVQYGFSHQKTILISVLINTIFVGLVYLSEKCGWTYLITLPICLIINYMVIRFIDSRFPFPLRDKSR